MLRIAHLINPVHTPAGSELARMQPITFASMERAVKEAAGIAEVKIYSAQFAEDHPVIPAWMIRTPDLDRSILDKVGSGKKLPFLRDMLDRLYVAAPDADYLIYTNVDIGLMPNFYRMVAHYAAKGYDAFSINRRRIPALFDNPDQLDLIYAEAGETHTGYDTIVFKRSLYEKFILGDICTGIPYGDTVLVHNLYAFSENYRLFTGKHLTFHIGMELKKNWGNSAQYAHNRAELKRLLRELYPHFCIEQFPAANLSFFVRHWKWLMNPTFDYPTMLRLDFAQLSRPRRPRAVKRHSGQPWLEYLVRRVNFPDED